MSAVDSDVWGEWIGRTQTHSDLICAAPSRGLAATMDCAQPPTAQGDQLPVCWHWLYFQDAALSSQLGKDGHPRRGDFLPPISLPRRMWAGSRVRIVAPLLFGQWVQRESTITAISYKRGRSGELLFITVRHRLFQGEQLAIEEEQDLVYRERPVDQPAVTALATAHPAPRESHWSRELTPDPVLLFRYSALTFNSHRIHYDRHYAVAEEGYAALVVQGPLTATLLLDLLRRELPAAQVVNFEFRAIRPLLEGALMTLHGRRDGRRVTLWAQDSSGELAMELQAELAEDQVAPTIVEPH